MDHARGLHPLDATVPAGLPSHDEAGPGRMFEWRQLLAFGLIAVGVIAVMVAWFGIARETEPWKQMPFLASGGIGGAAAIGLGVTSLISYEHARDREVLAEVLRRQRAIEERLDRLMPPDPPPSAGNGADTTPRRRAARSTRRR